MYLSGDPLMGRLLALPASIRLDLRGMAGTKTQAYWSIRKVKLKLVPGSRTFAQKSFILSPCGLTLGSNTFHGGHQHCSNFHPNLTF